MRLFKIALPLTTAVLAFLCFTTYPLVADNWVDRDALAICGVDSISYSILSPGRLVCFYADGTSTTSGQTAVVPALIAAGVILSLITMTMIVVNWRSRRAQ